jgi:hypothetical protein
MAKTLLSLPCLGLIDPARLRAASSGTIPPSSLIPKDLHLFPIAIKMRIAALLLAMVSSIGHHVALHKQSQAA